jgi:hypothetical protein
LHEIADIQLSRNCIPEKPSELDDKKAVFKKSIEELQYFNSHLRKSMILHFVIKFLFEVVSTIVIFTVMGITMVVMKLKHDREIAQSIE